MFDVQGIWDHAQMAFKILSVSAISAEREGIFSEARMILTKSRSIIENAGLTKLGCTKSQSKNNFLPVTYLELKSTKNWQNTIVAGQTQGGD